MELRNILKQWLIECIINCSLKQEINDILFVYSCLYMKKTFVTQITGYYSFVVVFLRKTPNISSFDFDPDTYGLLVEATEHMKLIMAMFQS